MISPISPHCEYIELYNKSDNDIEYEKVIYSQTYYATTSHCIENLNIPAHSYVLLTSTKSSQIEYLSKYADCYPIYRFSLPKRYSSICLKLEDGTILDSLHYESSWFDDEIGNTDISLERIDVDLENIASNWTSSRAAEGCTPGKTNQTSASTIETDKITHITCDKDYITHDGRDERDCMINFYMDYPKSSFRFTLAIYTDKGNIVYKHADNILYHEYTEFEWKGVNNNNSPLGRGMYSVKLTVIKDNGEKDGKSFNINIW
jgi:hypothetical protein